MSEKCRAANIQCSPQGDASLGGFGTDGASLKVPDGSRQGDAASDNDVCVGPDTPDGRFHRATGLEAFGPESRSEEPPDSTQS